MPEEIAPCLYRVTEEAPSKRGQALWRKDRQTQPQDVPKRPVSHD
jgi:hypothetical protein